MGRIHRDRYQEKEALAWQALNKMNVIWNSHVSREAKIRLFRATVETVLLYGCEAWTLNATLEKSLNGCYTRMLRAALGVKWYDHVSNTTLYRDLIKAGDLVAARRMRLAGHCLRHKELVASDLVVWMPRHGVRARGRRRSTYVDVLMSDADVQSEEELTSCMVDREVWRCRVAARLRST